jgi:hypothetical protein
MKEELRKSLTDLIDETLLELEELKKSRFSAAEIEVKGPGEGIAGKPSNGDLHAKAEDKKDDDEDEEAEKAEGHNRQSDPDGGHHKPVAGEGSEHGAGPSHGSHEGKSRDMSGHNSESDPGQTHKVAKGDDDKDEDDKKKKDKDAKGGEEHEKKEKEAIGKLAGLAGMKKGESPEQVNAEVQKLVMHGLKKAQEDSDTLMKSYVDEKVKPLEDKLSSILDLVNKIADQPVAPKGQTARAVPLMKSDEQHGESLSKSEVASKLFELKKSGTKVDSLDITRAEMGHGLSQIIEKYKIS